MVKKKKRDFSQPTEIQSAAAAFISIPKKEVQEEELDFIENKWDKIEKDSGKDTTDITTTNTTITSTNNSGNISRMLWNKSLSESKKNFQYTLAERQQEEFRSAALLRGYTRNGKIGKEPNASKFLQELIDNRVWEAMEFINEAGLWENFQQWKNQR
jgi:hypothetical protein